MKRRLIPAFVMLLAGTVTCVIGLVYRYSVLRLLTTLLIVLLSFYVIGSLFKWLLDLLIPLNKDEEEEEGEEESEEEQQEEMDDKTVFKG